LPGGQGTGGPAAVDKVFDFSDDPIPVNATDLFIQVVYRGQLGDEPDGIAVGNYDAREPTFVGIVNNTDYFWSSLTPPWREANPTYPLKNMDTVRVCVGAGTDARWAFYADPVASQPALPYPASDTGVIRLAMIFAKPAPATQQFSLRVSPVVTDAGNSPIQRSYFTRGQQHQANRESISTETLNAPMVCTETSPSATSYWCNTPIQKRRGIALGAVAAFVHYQSNQDLVGGDVDAQPLPAFSDLQLTDTGITKYNDETLDNCPPPPPNSAQNAKALTELLETAAQEGVRWE
jgi:hypothetical protein